MSYYIYAKDYSASTSDVAFYHANGLKTLEQFKSDVKKINGKAEESQIIYLHWGHVCEKVDEATTVDAYKERRATGNNTLPETIIQWIKSNIEEEYKIKLLYIITDGLIGGASLNRCLNLNEGVNYEKVVFHAFHRNLNSIDLSVAASFLQGRCTIYRNYEQLDDVDISEAFDYDKITLDNFDSERENLKSYIKLKYINSSNGSAAALTEIDKLKKLRNKLFSDLSQSTGSRINLDTIDKNNFIIEFKKTSWYKSLKNPSYDSKIVIEKSITSLINYITSSKKSYAFDALKFDTTFRSEVPEEPIVDVNFATDQEIEFLDIILDDEKGIPVILCTDLNLLDKIVFHTSVSTASFSKFRSTMECPLYLLNDTDLNDSIGYFYTLNVYKQLLKNPTKTEPRTRRPFHGGLVLVDTDDFDKYNDYVLSATYFNSKKVNYNVGLFYFVIWKICEPKKWMDKNVVDKFKNYMLRRVSTTSCKIGLSSLPLDPPMVTSLPTALWYCVELSSCIFKDDSIHFAHERLRMYYGIAHAMIEILNCLKYDLDLEIIDKRRDLIRHVMILKKIPVQREKHFYLIEKVFKNNEGFVVCEIENEADVKKLNYLKLDHRGMLRDDIIEEPVDLNDFIHILYSSDTSEVQICEKTLRPFFMIDQDKSFYSQVYEKAKQSGIINIGGELTVQHNAILELDFSRILSYYNLFLRYVKDCNTFPTLDEFKEYILKKKKYKDESVTIFPVNVYKELEKVFLEYQNAINDMSVSEFVKVRDMYVNRIERIKAENVLKFESEDRIREIISKEESKVNIVKVTM